MTSPSTIMYRRASHSEDLVVDSVSVIYLQRNGAPACAQTDMRSGTFKSPAICQTLLAMSWLHQGDVFLLIILSIRSILPERILWHCSFRCWLADLQVGGASVVKNLQAAALYRFHDLSKEDFMGSQRHKLYVLSNLSYIFTSEFIQSGDRSDLPRTYQSSHL